MHESNHLRQFSIPVNLMFDADQETCGTPAEQAHQAVHQINLELQRNAYGLAAQIEGPAEDVVVTETCTECGGGPHTSEDTDD